MSRGFQNVAVHHVELKHQGPSLLKGFTPIFRAAHVGTHAAYLFE